MEITINVDDNIELLKQYPDNYFDSVVTDCPYGLGKEPNALKLLQDWIDHGYHEIKGSGFMGKSWDSFVPQPLFWKEVFRVLKPGGYVLAFFGTRTYDWGTLAIRVAGFEIRDMICWHYGSGFPKNLDISKQVDKMAGVERRVIGVDRSKVRVNSEKNHKNGQVANLGLKSGESGIITEASSEKAKECDGWGTALKPATEPICVARKPLYGTVAENVLKYGTGGININDCRIEFESDDDFKSATLGTGQDIRGGSLLTPVPSGLKNIEANTDGRFPANVIFDPFMADELDNQSGILQSGGGRKGEDGKRNYLDNVNSIALSGARSSTGKTYIDPIRGEYKLGNVHNDNGGASRFFYCAKTSQFERHAGCENISPVKTTDHYRKENPDNAFQRGDNARTNFHPTVKPIALMRWIQRLVTPKNGICLDPYAGSGTSGCSAQFEDINIVLMEMEEPYIPIIEARVKYWSVEQNRINYLNDIRVQKEEISKDQLTLFGT